MMQVSSQLMELCSCCLLLQLSLLQSSFPCEFFELFSDLVVLLLDVVEITLSGVEVMLVLATVESSVVLLYYLCLFVEKLRLFVLVFLCFLIHELASTVIATQNPLNSQRCTNFVLELPLHFEHAPELLDHDGS